MGSPSPPPGSLPSREARTATVADVAKHAGVSTATVSHVINRTRIVSPETTSRVEAAITATGFLPNPYARALRASTTQTLGFLASDIANPFSTAVMKGIEMAVRAADHSLLVANSGDGAQSQQAALTMLERRRVDGLIVALTADVDDATVNRLRTFPVPVVLLDRSADLDADQVLVENTVSTSTLIDRLLDRGHERIAVVAGEEHHSTTQERVSGWKMALGRAGLPVPLDLLRFCGRDPRAAQAWVEYLWRLPASARPTAVFSTNTDMTQGLYRAVSQLGIESPSELSMVAFDDFEWADLLRPALTCLAQPREELGMQAVALLLERLTDPALPTRVVRLNPTMKLRSSIAAPLSGE